MSQRKGYQASRKQAQIKDSDEALSLNTTCQSVGTQTDLSCFDETSPIAISQLPSKSQLLASPMSPCTEMALPPEIPCTEVACTEMPSIEMPRTEMPHTEMPCVEMPRTLKKRKHRHSK